MDKTSVLTKIHFIQVQNKSSCKFSVTFTWELSWDNHIKILLDQGSSISKLLIGCFKSSLKELIFILQDVIVLESKIFDISFTFWSLASFFSEASRFLSRKLIYKDIRILDFFQSTSSSLFLLSLYKSLPDCSLATSEFLSLAFSSSSSKFLSYFQFLFTFHSLWHLLNQALSIVRSLSKLSFDLLVDFYISLECGDLLLEFSILEQ